MYVKTISGVDYHLYEDEQEFRKHHLKEDLKDDWRKAGEGEWALSDATEAYLTVYKTQNRRYALNRSKILLRQKRIRTLINKEVEQLMDDLGITKTYLLENAKSVVDKTDVRDGDKLRALETLMKISGLLTTDKKSDSIALIQEFTGFSKDKLKAFETGLIEENASQ